MKNFYPKFQNSSHYKETGLFFSPSNPNHLSTPETPAVEYHHVKSKIGTPFMKLYPSSISFDRDEKVQSILKNAINA